MLTILCLVSCGPGETHSILWSCFVIYEVCEAKDNGWTLEVRFSPVCASWMLWLAEQTCVLVCTVWWFGGVRFGLICLCIVRFGVCDKWKDNGWKWEGHLSIAAAQPRYKRSPWDWFTFLRHLFYSKMTTIVDPGYAEKLLLHRRGAELSWLQMHDKKGAIVASSCCMTTTAGSDCAALPWHM